MPPVRWKYVLVSGLMLVQLLIFVEAQRVQESIPMSSDGWRPIIGTGRKPNFEPEIETQQITQYKNPIPNVEIDIVKAETVIPSTTMAPLKRPTKGSAGTITNNINGDMFYKQSGKIPPHSKFTSPGPSYHTITSSAHVPHIPIGAAHVRPGQFGQLQKRPVGKPVHPHFALNGKRKPIRTQVASPSSRDEVFVRPPNQGQFSSFAKGQNNIKTRDTQNILGNHFSIKPSSHIDFSNGFVLPPSTDNFQQYKSQPVLVFSQTPSPNNEIRFQNDVYTRNLVPPPLSQFQKEKQKLQTTKIKESIGVTEPYSQQFGLRPSQFQENLVPQQPSQFEQSFSFQKHFNKPKGANSDVQVTKEKLKVFHSSAPLYNPNDYVDYDFHTVKKPDTFPKLQTYEVTEGKWVDSPNPFTFSFMDPQPIPPQKLRMPTVSPSPAVELNVPPFLPTPYRPEGVVPTSPTQSEASTVFTQVSTKMNRYKNEALNKNPLFFDVKEVSTHYPILGKPAPILGSSPVMDTNSEISNEITTLKQVQISEGVAPTTKKPKHRRRRPQPRRTTTTSTTTTAATTTEEQPVTESYEVQKTQDTYEEVSVETEKPQRRQRPRPNRIRTNNYEVEDITEKRIRSRYRNRQRVYGTKTDTQNDIPRKRTKRPPPTEITSNDNVPEDSLPLSDETTETIVKHFQSAERETQGIFESKYTQDSEEAPTTRPTRIESELPGRHYESTQSEEESKYATTIVSTQASEVNNRQRFGDVREAPERNGFISGTTTEDVKTTSIHLPENEIDYSTPVPTIQPIDEHIDATLATTLPTTTTTEATTKSHRIRGRPIKYGSSNRPRFSVKDYRQRLNQYTSTTPSTTTDIVKTTSDGIRLRFPTRKQRTRPTSRTTTPAYYEPEEEQPEPIRRGGFKPKEPRHGVTSTEATNANVITEKSVKAVNTRLRPFGRYKSSTESTVAPKVSIKPNLFSARRRSPGQLSNLRMKGYNRLKNTTEETTTYGSEVELTEPITVQPLESEDEDTEIGSDKVEAATEVETTTADFSEVDYSQRVSELTSSFKNEYDTPGLFKSVSPTSRRIPSYFTISTDDPILPIEAFFPNLKDKTR